MNRYEAEYPGIVDRAVRIALDVHAGKKDRYGAPCILHALNGGLRGATEEEAAAGILHDVIEDATEWNLERLRVEGFSEFVIGIVDCLTKREGEEWDDYIARVMENEAAMRVKLFDLEHNMTASRAPVFGFEEFKRFQRYVSAWRRITDAMKRY